MSNEMVNTKTGEITQRSRQELSWAELKEQATMLVRTGFLPPALNTPEKVIAVVLTGRELGVPMMESIRGINVIQGKPAVSPQLMLALALRTGTVEYHKIEMSEAGSTFTIKRKGHPEHVATFNAADARAMGLDGKDNYKKQGPVMYSWRAIAKGLRVIFPDAISGLYTPEELGASVVISTEGEIVPETITEATHAKPQIKTPQAAATGGIPESSPGTRNPDPGDGDDSNAPEQEIPFGDAPAGPKTINEKQLGLLMMKAREAGVDEVKLDAAIMAKFGKASKKHLTSSELTKLLDSLSNRTVRAG